MIGKLIHQQIVQVALDLLFKSFDATKPSVDASLHHLSVAQHRLFAMGISVLYRAAKAFSRCNTEVSDVLAHGGHITAVLTDEVRNVPENQSTASNADEHDGELVVAGRIMHSNGVYIVNEVEGKTSKCRRKPACKHGESQQGRSDDDAWLLAWGPAANEGGKLVHTP